MQKKTLSKWDLTLYSETLSNGLTVYMVPKKGNNIYATFTTKYGSRINTFVPIGEKEMITVPDGIAHFLEHKVFEEKDGEDPFTFFGARGADANASTSFEKTTYLFSGTSFFEDNLKYLLDFVQNPYFTDENVEKEKGIIGEEIKMYEDNPFTRLYERAVQNAFVLDPIRIPTQGTLSSISKINQEMLYTCYNTFYHPSNMILVITGNIRPEETIRLVKENQEKKSFPIDAPLQIKEYEEPDTVFKEEETIFLPVSIPKFCVGVKIRWKDRKEKRYTLQTSLLQYFNSKLGVTSLLAESLKKEGLISEDLGISMVYTDTHILFMIMGESEKPSVVIEKIKKSLASKEVDEEEFSRKKKVMMSSYIYMSDNIYSINHKIMNNVIRYQEVIEEDKELENLSYSKFKEMIDKTDFSHIHTVVISPKK